MSNKTSSNSFLRTIPRATHTTIVSKIFDKQSLKMLALPPPTTKALDPKTSISKQIALTYEHLLINNLIYKK